jgi:beta-glucosidase/6-phospho-beta-glucosidase/beta-galactosidase
VAFSPSFVIVNEATEACDTHYYLNDFDLASKFGMNAFRISTGNLSRT